MARAFHKFFLVAVAIATLVQSSTAQRRHVVGDALGWIVPPNGAAAYSNWAANQTFAVGDSLVFNFATGSHTVAEVSQSSFNSCNTARPISTLTNGPANVTLNTPGAHYYICTVPGHCLGGQKLAVNVRAAASSPAPSPSSGGSPSPGSAPTPARTPAPTPTPASAPAPTRTPTPTPASAPAPPAPAPASTPNGSPPSPPSPATPPSTTPPTGEPPAGVTAPPPPNNSPRSLGSAGLFTSFLAVMVCLLY